MNAQHGITRVPPSAPPPTRNAGGFFEPERSRHGNGFWREVLHELRQMRWIEARDVVARTIAAIALIAFLAMFAAGCGVLAKAVTGA